MGKYHPHGDSSIYDALVRMAQPFSMATRWWKGRELRVGGWRPAALCGTPSAPFAHAAASLQTSTRGPWISVPTTTRASRSPSSSHARAQPVGERLGRHRVGMATNIPPHQSAGDHRRRIHLIQTPARRLAEILEFVQGPDFSHRRLHLGRQGYWSLHQGPRADQAPAKGIERTGKDHEQIIVTEIPYQSTRPGSSSNVASLINEKRLEGMNEPRDESDRDGMRIVFPLKRGEQAEVISNKSLQAHATPDWLRHHHALPSSTGSRASWAWWRSSVFHRSPHRGCAAAHRVRTAARRATRAHLARLPESFLTTWMKSSG